MKVGEIEIPSLLTQVYPNSTIGGPRRPRGKVTYLEQSARVHFIRSYRWRYVFYDGLSPLSAMRH